MNTILKFTPILKTPIWGGTRLAPFKGLDTDLPKIGESWEVSDVTGDESVVSEGPLAGTTLRELLATHGREILGERLLRKFQGRFPLLIKFIDAEDRLSVQVHPDDALAHRRHGTMGKTEMWYCLTPEPGAYLYAGLRAPLTPGQYRERIATNTIVEALRRYDVHEGDVYYLPAGRVHAIGPGSLILEIQETSDITYRIYDYDRRDAAGHPRQLHVAESLEAVDLSDTDGALTRSRGPLRPGQPILLQHSEYFEATLLQLTAQQTLPLRSGDSFTVLIVTDGTLTLTLPDAATPDAATPDAADPVTLTRGSSALIPASATTLLATPTTPEATLILVTA